MNRGKKLALNSLTSFIYQILTIICGFILPRLILSHYGSEVNGLTNSIGQFLGIIAFLELGVGAVVQSALYKPLANKDFDSVSKIVVSGNIFFKRLATILLCYIVVLILVYPRFVNDQFDFGYSATLIIAMSISSFAQYYFGVVDRLLLTADQRGYIQYISQAVTLVLNTILCVIFINIGASIQIIKLTTSLVYLLRPIYLRIYINKHYHINRHITYSGEPIKQKWNGVAQHVAAVVLDNTDTIVLTIFSTLSNVSIYGVYHLVVNGVKTLFVSMTSGVQALLGELWAKREYDNLRSTFSWAEWSIHTGVTLVFGCTASLIVPFAEIYTRGVVDANYNVPLFALLITLANAMHCLRIPYNIMILAGGHYKQTQSNYIIAALLNIIISIITVKIWGLIGVAIGTLIAMLYQTIWMAWYDSKHFLNIPMNGFFKHFAVDAVSFSVAYILSDIFKLSSITYQSWVVLSLKKAVVYILTIFAANYLFYREYMRRLLGAIVSRLNSKVRHS